jgi:4-hydroxythreonine-4-phosphate dehydrogenase
MLTVGDPAGVGPELVAKLLSSVETRKIADIILIGDEHDVNSGAAIAGVDVSLDVIDEVDDAHDVLSRKGSVLLRRSTPKNRFIPTATVSAAAGLVAIEHLTEAVGLVKSGVADALLFGPLNKASLKAAGLKHQDEGHFLAELLGQGGYFCEVNVVDRLWTTRVTSHISLRDVADKITPATVAAAISIANDTLLLFGFSSPRIAVCGLNPHAGDNGIFGREEIEIIAPTVARMRSEGLAVEGPFPPDTIFPRAWSGAYDAVVTMYHDQGQIALKALGFGRGVTVLGGQPIPIVTPAQGTAFDIVGKNLASVDAIERAFKIAATMGARRHVAA